jgi:hypothetical protein
VSTRTGGNKKHAAIIGQQRVDVSRCTCPAGFGDEASVGSHHQFLMISVQFRGERSGSFACSLWEEGVRGNEVGPTTANVAASDTNEKTPKVKFKRNIRIRLFYYSIKPEKVATCLQDVLSHQIAARGLGGDACLRPRTPLPRMRGWCKGGQLLCESAVQPAPTVSFAFTLPHTTATTSIIHRLHWCAADAGSSNTLAPVCAHLHTHTDINSSLLLPALLH